MTWKKRKFLLTEGSIYHEGCPEGNGSEVFEDYNKAMAAFRKKEESLRHWWNLETSNLGRPAHDFYVELETYIDADDPDSYEPVEFASYGYEEWLKENPEEEDDDD